MADVFSALRTIFPAQETPSPMKITLLALTFAIAALPAFGQDAVATSNRAVADNLQILDAADIDPTSFLWQWRIVAVLADSPLDPSFERQMREIDELPGDLFDRDVIVLYDSTRNSGSALRQMLRPRGFVLAIIGKDGEIKRRSPSPRTVREIGEIIDRFPLRRQELLDRLPAGR